MDHSDYVERNFLLLSGVQPREGDVERTTEVLSRVLGAIDYSFGSVVDDDLEECDFEELISRHK